MDNREKILTNALDLFYTRGYDAVGIQQIVDAAGLTKPTMYYYFGSKRGLLDALLGEQYEKLEQCIRITFLLLLFILAKEKPQLN